MHKSDKIEIVEYRLNSGLWKKMRDIIVSVSDLRLS